MTLRYKKGFTLIELLVVISVIALLSTFAIIALDNARKKARDARRVSDLKQIASALELFYDKYGRYPITAGHTYWDGHWMNFQTCMETGVGCGF
ncbi:MAG: prepilin-type N-terminal cleavage/methylation domain-containing protein, partial [bacterium]